MDITVLQMILGVVFGGAFIGFIEFLIKRNDEKNNKSAEVLHAVNNLETTMNERFDSMEQKSIERFNLLDEKIEVVEAKGDERAAISARVRILRFADELQEGRKHSKESYDQCVGSDVTFYEHYCATHPNFKNNQTELTVEYIKHNYAERLEKHDFL